MWYNMLEILFCKFSTFHNLEKSSSFSKNSVLNCDSIFQEIIADDEVTVVDIQIMTFTNNYISN